MQFAGYWGLLFMTCKTVINLGNKPEKKIVEVLHRIRLHTVRHCQLVNLFP